jgi:hypothetical protein
VPAHTFRCIRDGPRSWRGVEAACQCGDRQDGRVGDQQMQVVWLAVELNQLGTPSVHTPDRVCSQKSSIAEFRILRRYW